MLKRLTVLLKRFNCFLNGGHYYQIRWDRNKVWLECSKCCEKTFDWDVIDQFIQEVYYEKGMGGIR